MFGAMLMAAAFAASADTGPVLPAGAVIRVVVSSIGPGWRDAVVAHPVGGCLLVDVRAEQAPRRRLGVFLHSIERIQVRDARGRWTELSMTRAREEDGDCARE